MRNDEELVIKIKLIAEMPATFMTDAEKVQRILAEIDDHRATRAAQIAEYERQLAGMERELAKP